MEKPDENLHTVYIAVGANIGDRISGCRRGVERLTEAGDVVVLEHSRYYYSAPMHYTEQPWFVNAVFQASTRLDPVSLLTKMKVTETAAGRPKEGIRFGPRVLDLDLIFYDNAVIRTPDLMVPHPRMHQRPFVLLPLCDIAADLVHPVLGLTIGKLLSNYAAAGWECYAINDKVIDKTATA